MAEASEVRPIFWTTELSPWYKQLESPPSQVDHVGMSGGSATYKASKHKQTVNFKTSETITHSRIDLD